MARQLIAVFLAVLALAASAAPAWAQSGTQGRTRATAGGTALDITVTDGSGAPLKNVRIAVAGPVTRDAATNENGGVKLTGLKPGTYRLRFDGDGWVSLERELTVAGRTPTMDVDVTLTAAPPPPPPPPPPAAQTKPGRTVDERPVGESRVTDVADYADRNLIRSGEPQKMNVFGCTGYATTRLLQIREPLDNRHLEDADETLYVLAGEGTISMKGRQENLTAGVLAVIPRGTGNAITRRSKGPLILVSVVSGPPCSGSDR